MNNHKVDNMKTALDIVRQAYPTATMEGSTFDWTFWIGSAGTEDRRLVAIAMDNRRVKRPEWVLTVFAKPRRA